MYPGFIASYGRSGNGECVDEQMDGQKNDMCRHACMGTYVNRLEKEPGQRRMGRTLNYETADCT